MVEKCSSCKWFGCLVYFCAHLCFACLSFFWKWNGLRKELGTQSTPPTYPAGLPARGGAAEAFESRIKKWPNHTKKQPAGVLFGHWSTCYFSHIIHDPLSKCCVPWRGMLDFWSWSDPATKIIKDGPDNDEEGDWERPNPNQTTSDDNKLLIIKCIQFSHT